MRNPPTPVTGPQKISPDPGESAQKFAHAGAGTVVVGGATLDRTKIVTVPLGTQTEVSAYNEI